MLEVASHEFIAEEGIDKFVFTPGNMEALTKVEIVNGEPKVFLGIQTISFGEGTYAGLNWNPCPNKEICEYTLAEYEKRQA